LPSKASVAMRFWQDDIVILSEARNPRILLAEQYITPSLKML